MRSVVGAAWPFTRLLLRLVAFFVFVFAALFPEAECVFAPFALVAPFLPLLSSPLLFPPPLSPFAPPSPARPRQGPRKCQAFFGFAPICSSLMKVPALLFGIRRHNSRQEHGHHTVAVAPEHFEHHVLPGLQPAYRLAIIFHRRHRLLVHL